MECGSVLTFPDHEIELTFSPGPAGILLEAVVRCENRAIGARVVGFPPSLDTDFFVQGRTTSPYPTSPSAIPTLASEYLAVGVILVSIDAVCTKNMSFDRIMTLLHAKSSTTRRLRFKDVEAAWLNSANRGSPSMEVFNDNILERRPLPFRVPCEAFHCFISLQ